ncbi:hypothetical protein BRD01_03910 [Halobacteriales archaeon QS_8_65_32]|nr:MAG: hypothetical protein BRD01_03910 [Halobacteriales archaeon QS_8_65_32]
MRNEVIEQYPLRSGGMKYETLIRANGCRRIPGDRVRASTDGRPECRKHPVYQLVARFGGAKRYERPVTSFFEALPSRSRHGTERENPTSTHGTTALAGSRAPAHGDSCYQIP